MMNKDVYMLHEPPVTFRTPSSMCALTMHRVPYFRSCMQECKCHLANDMQIKNPVEEMLLMYACSKDVSRWMKGYDQGNLTMFSDFPFQNELRVRPQSQCEWRSVALQVMSWCQGCDLDVQAHRSGLGRHDFPTAFVLVAAGARRRIHTCSGMMWSMDGYWSEYPVPPALSRES